MFLVGYLFDLGTGFAMSGMGPSGPEQELLAWQVNTGIELEPWQSRWLKRLSAAFTKQELKSSKRDCPAPWIPEEPAPEDRVEVARRVRALLRS